MDLFTVDTVGSSENELRRAVHLPTVSRQSVLTRETTNNGKKPTEPLQEESDDEDYGGLPPPSTDIFQILREDEAPGNFQSYPKAGFAKDFADDIGCATVPTLLRKTRFAGTTAVEELTVTDVRHHMKAAVVTPAMEKHESLATLSMSERQLRELNRKERAKTKGKDWFNLPTQEMTEDIKNELELIRMRSVLDPKHFYKRSEMKTLPKYFQIGKVIDSPLDHYNERGAKKVKSKTLVDELLEDAKFQKYNKKKYAEALEKRKKKAYHKAAIKMKKLKKQKK
ncbi:deoxynucleotidyltransferase terminal-interacting protein 2 [Toxorhynchites rutilus septentrionalis]|uniref:deoxynucleotidyltransferase terminal-interacting protein 2 n=1 Tax=Toxorhynchites rutilus septentrionalis TaxID=329112 RepID=UPI002479B7D3|nr:deoxynucleotidyltransferase terminal-interacting protein 2 [Toxorhynchites rutilus septentrionalis]